MRPVCLIVRDGWGHNPDPRGNAVLAAAKPNTDALMARYPWTLLDTSGEPVGLPAGYQGSSEVGHLNMGAGRIVVQELKRLDEGLATGEVFGYARWRGLMTAWKTGGGRLHLFGLLQDEGVHAHQEHLFKVMRRARQEHAGGEIVIHPFLDGRDTSPRSCEEYIAALELVMAEVGRCRIGTAMGRYYAMDRSRNWRLTDTAYECIVAGQGRPAGAILEAVHQAYAQDRTPDGVEMFDEYIPPYALGGYDGIRDGDCVFHTNYRQDRAIQLTRAFIDDQYPGTRSRRPKVTYLGFTRYYDELEEYLLPPMTEGGGMEELLGEVISRAGLRQLRLAETQKFRHVTSFFNGKATTPYPGEDQVEIKGRFDPATFATHPEMEAYGVTEELLRRLADNPYQPVEKTALSGEAEGWRGLARRASNSASREDAQRERNDARARQHRPQPEWAFSTGCYAFIAVNYANGDMVGHTGDFEAARRAIEVVDECLGKVVARLLELDAHLLITADHGNSEQMVDYQTGKTKTSHTLFPVECIYVARGAENRKLVSHGKLADIAPTVLELLGLPKPAAMTASSLLG